MTLTVNILNNWLFAKIELQRSMKMQPKEKSADWFYMDGIAFMK